ncbi:MAG TPA: lysylphosphatidylglycerol synthase transmembrane domain-containing protein [Streptosporangiaceae bacterium]|nr:lysylphosphatidylglycerol synthase transmembrane domain-containing protein [Streptosporangiaceae bacterium]
MAYQRVSSGAMRTFGDAARYVLGIGLGVVILVLLFGRRGELLASWRQLGRVNLGWLAVAACAEAMSLWMFAYLQHRVLRLTGTRIRMRALYLLTLANDAIAGTVPGEPAVSSAYRYRYYRRHGANGAGAGWTVFTILVAQAIGMSLLLLVGVAIALGTSTSASGTGLTVLGLVIVLAAGAILIRRDLVLRLAGQLVRAFQRATGHPKGNVSARVETTLTRMREIPLSKTATAGIVALAAAVWMCDFWCLVCSFRAVHAPIPWDGVLLAYGAAQVVGSFPIVPGGLGIVEGSLAVILVAYGTGRVAALSAAITFRIVNFWLAIAIGWLSVGLIAYRTRRAGRHRAGPASDSDLRVIAALPPD